MRLKFYGTNDYGTFFQVERAIDVLDTYDAADTKYKISDVIELYNALQYIEHDLFPQSFDETKCDTYRALKPKLHKTISVFFKPIDTANVLSVVTDVDYEYHSDLLNLLARFGAYERCDAKTIFLALGKVNIGMGEMLANEAFVKAYDSELRNRFVADSSNTEYLIRKYVENDIHNIYHLPSSLSDDDAHKLVGVYLDSADANPNFVELISKAPVKKEAGIDAKNKLKARRKHDKWAEEFFKGNAGIETGCEVSISESQIEPSVLKLDGLVAKASYSKSWLEENLDYPTILNNFIYLFEFVDRNIILTLPSYASELGVFERFMRTTGKDAYPEGAAFDQKARCSFLQTMMYYRFLQTKGIELEAVISWFFSGYLQKEFNAKNFKFQPSSSGASFLEKSRHIFSEMESVIKQFSLYVENGELDLDLLSITSNQISYKTIPSLMPVKYAYLTDNEDIVNILRLLFSDQSGIKYISQNLQDDDAARLLIRHEVSYQDFLDHQRPPIDFLIEHGILENTGKRVRFVSSDWFLVLKCLFDVGTISYYHYKPELRKVVDEMVAKSWLLKEGSLLARPEASYFNYYLNQKEFSNGPDLRNAYLHGTQPPGEDNNEHFQTYITGLKLVIALVIKINDDFCIKADEILSPKSLTAL